MSTNKFEIRSTKHETISNETNSNVQNEEELTGELFHPFENLNLGFVSSFDIRISDFVQLAMLS